MRHFSHPWLGATCIVAAASCGGGEFAPGSAGGTAGGTQGGMPGAAGKGGGGSGGTNGGAAMAGAVSAGSGGAVAGASPMAGSGGAGMSEQCRDQADCQKCCDERFPDAHGPFAGKFHSCGCDSCSQACGDSLCLDAYSWSDACLSCIREQITTGCSAAAVACNGVPGCEDFAACSFSCL